MAKVKFYDSADMANFDWAFGFDTSVPLLKPLTIQWINDSDEIGLEKLVYRGTFEYSKNPNNPTGDLLGVKDGTLTGYDYYVDQILRVKMSGFSTDAVTAFLYMEKDTPEYNAELLGQVLSKADNITGSAFNDVLKGFAGNDTMSGGARDDFISGDEGNDVIMGNGGRDTMNGGAGNDVLDGGNGKDVFIFDQALTAGNADTIQNYVTAGDKIRLENGVFKTLVEGNLANSAFVTGTVATTAEHRIIYNSATGALLYDADGAGGNDAVQFATISGITGTLSANDFAVI